MNDVIGNKIIVATMKFTDWIEELNRPGNLAELERSVSNIGLFLEDASEIASKVALEVGGIAKRAIDGYNELPEWMRDMGLVGAFVMGKRGWLALGAASALIDRGKDFATGIDLFVNTGKMSMQELSALSWDKLHELVEKADKFSKESAEKSKQNFTSAALATTASLKREYEQRERDLKDALEQEYRNLKAYQEASKVPLVGYIYDDKTRDSQEHINELQERLSAINLQLEYTFEKSFAASQAQGPIFSPESFLVQKKRFPILMEVPRLSLLIFNIPSRKRKAWICLALPAELPSVSLSSRLVRLILFMDVSKLPHPSEAELQTTAKRKRSRSNQPCIPLNPS